MEPAASIQESGPSLQQLSSAQGPSGSGRHRSPSAGPSIPTISLKPPTPAAGQSFGSSNPHGQLKGSNQKPKSGPSTAVGKKPENLIGQHNQSVESDSDSVPSDYAQDTRARNQKGLRSKKHSSAKRQTQKERKIELNGQLPDGIGPMRTVVHTHCRFLLQIQEKNLATMPGPPSPQERQTVVTVSKHPGFDEDPPNIAASKHLHSKAYQGYVSTQLRKLCLSRFLWDWESSWTHPFNEVMSLIFYRTLDMALMSGEYNNYFWSQDHNTHAIVSSLMEKYFYHLQSEWKAMSKDADHVAKTKEKQRLSALRKRVSKVFFGK